MTAVPGVVARSATLLSLYRQLLEWIDRGAAVVVMAVMAVMVTIVSAQVFFRYVLNDSIDWAEEISRLCFVWTMFLAIPLGLKHGAHIGLELLVARLPAVARAGLFRLMSTLAAAVCALVAWEAWKMSVDTWDEMIPSIALSSGLFFVGVFIGAAHSVLRLIALAADGPAPSAHDRTAET